MKLGVQSKRNPLKLLLGLGKAQKLLAGQLKNHCHCSFCRRNHHWDNFSFPQVFKNKSQNLPKKSDFLLKHEIFHEYTKADFMDYDVFHTNLLKIHLLLIINIGRIESKLFGHHSTTFYVKFWQNHRKFKILI